MHMDLSAFYAQFREETADNARTIADGLLELERTPGDRATLDGIFRAAHTVKGSARLLGFAAVASLAHAMESLLDTLRTGKLALTPELNDVLLQANDALLALGTAASENRTITLDSSSLIARLEQVASGDPSTIQDSVHDPAASPPPLPAPDSPPAIATPSPSSDPPEGPSASPPIPARPPLEPTRPPAIPNDARSSTPAPPTAARSQRATVRVRVDRLDRLVAVAGELAVGQQEDTTHLQQLQAAAILIAQQQRALHALASELRQARLTSAQRQGLLHRVSELHLNGGELSQLLRTQHETYTRRTAIHAQLVDELEAEVFSARLVPVATIFAPLPRATRELARSLDKQIELVLVGEETEADRKVLDALSDPLLHMVRNAVDHGLEPPDERSAAGKASAGRLTVAATAEHGQIRIAVSDDGRGMNPVKLREIAVRKGLLDQRTADHLSDAEALDLIFMPGFSTSPIITDVSGRGVGMDVVRSRMIEVGGQVIVDSVLGRGTTITLVLPVSLMTSQVLLVEAGKQLWALPSRSCQGLLRLNHDTLMRMEGQALIKIEGKTAPLIPLADLLELPSGESSIRHGHALVIGTTRPIAVLVDRLMDEREVVIKPLGPLFPGHPVAAGAAPLPDGTLAIVLSAQGLLSNARRVRTKTATPTAVRHKHRLLITDDSFTTRELLRSILESAGYDVTTAIDGQDALDKLRADGRFDLVVSDVEMPRLDGFGLTASIRANEALTHLPVIIVTSLHSDAHKRQGIVAGAQAYIVKSQFDQSNLLAAVRDLLGGSA